MFACGHERPTRKFNPERVKELEKRWESRDNPVEFYMIQPPPAPDGLESVEDLKPFVADPTADRGFSKELGDIVAWLFFMFTCIRPDNLEAIRERRYSLYGSGTPLCEIEDPAKQAEVINEISERMWMSYCTNLESPEELTRFLHERREKEPMDAKPVVKVEPEPYVEKPFDWAAFRKANEERGKKRRERLERKLGNLRRVGATPSVEKSRSAGKAPRRLASPPNGKKGVINGRLMFSRKHIGKKVLDVVAIDPEFCRWAIRKARAEHGKSSQLTDFVEHLKTIGFQ